MTGLRLVDLDNRVVKSYVQGWSLVNRSGTAVLAGASNNNKIIEVCTTSDMTVIITCECGVVMRSVASVCPVRALTFKSLDIETSILMYGYRRSKSISYVNIIRSRSRSQEQQLVSLCRVRGGSAFDRKAVLVICQCECETPLA